MAKANPIPEGMTAVTPHLVIAGADKALEFYERAFGATVEARLAGPDGKLAHAQIRIGGAAIMLGEEAPAWGALSPTSLKGSPVTIHLYVDDADAAMDKAVKAGARATMPVAEMFWGDRYGKLEDPFGHHWSLATHVKDVSDAEMIEAMKNMPATPAE
jgi:PhnB protein